MITRQWTLPLAALAAVASSSACSEAVQAALEPVATVTVEPTTATLEVGEQLQLGATPRNTTGNPLPGRMIVWQSSDAQVVDISDTGLATGLATGPATLTATIDGTSGSAEITVVPPRGESGGVAELPRTYLDTRYVAPSGRTIRVAAGGDLQSALDGSRAGDVLMLDAGATFTGNFVLPVKSGSEWITIRSSTPDESLPPEGTRVSPAFASEMAKIVSPNMEPALSTAPGAHHYRVMAVEITFDSSVLSAFTLVTLGDGSSAQDTREKVPHNLILDRVYAHGHPGVSFQRCVALNGAFSAVIDSYLSGCHGRGFDSQAIAGWNGPGPFKIVNNYLEGAGENLMFGGADASIADLTPSDIEIRRNHFYKPERWRGEWSVKNLLELKHAQRVLIEGNVFEHTWVDAQNGTAVLFTTRNQDGGNPWAIVQDVTFRSNLVRRVGAGINILGRDDSRPSQVGRDFLFANNLIDEVRMSGFDGSGRAFLVAGGENVHIIHNTLISPDSPLLFTGETAGGFVFRDNLAHHGAYGIFGDGGTGGVAALDRYRTSWAMDHNLFYAGERFGDFTYPAETWYEATEAGVGFESGSRRLAIGSEYKGKASDGADVGADIDVLENATGGVVR